MKGGLEICVDAIRQLQFTTCKEVSCNEECSAGLPLGVAAAIQLIKYQSELYADSRII